MKVFVVIAFILVGCESPTQTALRENEPPAIAFVIAAQQGNPIQPAPPLNILSQQ